MRALFLAFAVAGFLTGAGHAQQRTQSPAYDTWCRDQGISRGSTIICWGYTFEQCMASRTSHTETCFLNPKYDPRFRRN